MREEGNSQQLVISITGFGDESKNFEAKLKELGGCFEDTLRDKTRVLVANKVNTEKYKVAASLNEDSKANEAITLHRYR